MRLLWLFALLAVGLSAGAKSPEYVQAVEFPYYSYPQQFWERELVWLKNIGIQTIAFSIPWKWHEPEPGVLDLTGGTSPRRDLLGFIRLLRRLELTAWIRPAADKRAPKQWYLELQKNLANHLEAHGGPIAFVERAEGAGVAFDAPPPPLPVATISAIDPHALAKSREALSAGHGSLLWTDVEDSLPPTGWRSPDGPLVRKGAVSLAGDERSTTALRRGAALLRYWAAALPSMNARPVRPVTGKFPAGVSATQLVSRSTAGPSAVSLVNRREASYRAGLRVWYPSANRTIALPAIDIPPGQALWLPIQIPLANGSGCRECTVFTKNDHIVYATAEVTSVEYENGILAMEFAAPLGGEVVVQLSSQPSGPLLAGGRPTNFDWDEKTSRARLPIPRGKGAGDRVRIGLAIEPPEASAFFVNANRLMIGKKTLVSTSYSSPEIAKRSRLLLPENFGVAATVKAPSEIDYEIETPAQALHGEFVELALEADGVLMNRARMQLLRPASLRVREAMNLHFGSETELPVTPPLVPVEPKAGRNVTVTIRNNFPEIRNYVLEAAGDGVEFSPARTEISIGPAMERDVTLRVFAEKAPPGLTVCRLRLSGAAEVASPLRFVVIPRNQAIAYTADLDGDGAPEWVLENRKVRAVFSGRDGGRWIEFVWKDSGVNVLPESGAMPSAALVDVEPRNDEADASLVFTCRNWRRTIRLPAGESKLFVDQDKPLPAESLRTEKKNAVLFEVQRPTPASAVYSLERAE